MGNKFRRLFSIENLPWIVAFVVSFGVVILEVLGRFDPYDIPTVILFCLSVLIVGLLVERIAYFERLEKAILANELGKKGMKGIYDVYLSRSDLPPYKPYIEGARQQIIVSSISLGETSTRYIEYLRNLAERRVYVRLLAFDPNSTFLPGVAKLRGISEDDLRHQIWTSLRVIEKHSLYLHGENKDYLQVKVYDWAPTWGGISVDPGTDHGKMLIDVFQYRSVIGAWPEIELRPESGGGELYSYYSQRFLQAWDDASSWPTNP